MQVIRNWNANNDRKLARDQGVCAGTNFYDALRWTIDRLRGVKTRRGVVMLTDAVDGFIPKRPVLVNRRLVSQFIDFNSDRDFQRAVRSIEESGITYYFVAVNTDLNPGGEVSPDLAEVAMPDLRQMRLRMERMAEVTGGSVVFPKRPEDVIPMYEQIALKLGSTYSLAYTPPGTVLDGQSHKIEVRVKPPGLKVHQSRQSYVAR
jgi:VWFA-related protein